MLGKHPGLGLLAPMTCIVCEKERPKDAEEASAWRPLLGAMPLGAHICSDDCYNKARQRIAIHGRADMPVEGEAPSEEETPEERAETEPPPAQEPGEEG